MGTETEAKSYFEQAREIREEASRLKVLSDNLHDKAWRLERELGAKMVSESAANALPLKPSST